MTKQKRKNGYNNYRARLSAIRKFVGNMVIIATLPTVLLLLLYTTLMFKNPYWYSIYWVQTTPQRIGVLVSIILALSVIYILKMGLHEQIALNHKKSISLRIGMLWFVSIMMLCSIFMCRYAQLFPFTYEEVIKVESYGLHTYSLQHIATDNAESHTHYYQIYQCRFDMFCQSIYSMPKYGMSTDIESIDFYIEDSNLYVIENNELAKVIDL